MFTYEVNSNHFPGLVTEPVGTKLITLGDLHCFLIVSAITIRSSLCLFTWGLTIDKFKSVFYLWVVFCKLIHGRYSNIYFLSRLISFTKNVQTIFSSISSFFFSLSLMNTLMYCNFYAFHLSIIVFCYLHSYLTFIFSFKQVFFLLFSSFLTF